MVANLTRLLFITALVLSSAVHGADDAHRPRIGLVLGGGGARGAAHIGVLEVLHDLRVPIDCVAGTSMGALVAGAYAAGVPLAVMREQLANADWNDMFVDNPDFSEMSHRNKQLSRRFLPGSESGVSADGVRYQTGVVVGQKIKLFINQLVRANQGERDLDKLPIPLSIIATDIGSGERVVLRDGSLSMAMRASMSVPGLLSPLDYRGHKLVDGGLVDNLPISEVRERCGAEVVIVVNVGSPLLKPEEVTSLLSISAQMVNILTEQNVTRSLATLKPGDIYIKPELDGVTATDFNRAGETADRGRLATEQFGAKLARLALDPDEFKAWHRAIEVTEQTSPRIDEIQITGLDKVNPAVIQRHLHLESGQSVRRSVINRDLLRMYGDGYYERVDYTVLTGRERSILRIMPVEKSWGPDYMRFGLKLQADSSQGSTFGLRAAYHNTWLNRQGGELLVTADVGSTNYLGINFYQPLDSAQRLFLEGSTDVEQGRLNLYEDNHRYAQYKNTETGFAASLGINVGLLGPLRLGWVQRRRYFDVDIGEPSLPKADVKFSGWKTSLDFDQFDRLHFPTHGWAASVAYFDSAQAGYSRADVDLRSAYSLGNTVLNGRLHYTGSPHGSLPVYDAGTLGGFQNMTAFSASQIIGDQIRYAGLRAEQIVGHLPLGLRGDMRLGFALEAAQVGVRYTETSQRGTINSASVYFGGETPFGPAYIGFGYSTSKVGNLFLFVGTQ